MMMVERTLSGDFSQIMQYLHKNIIGDGEITACEESTEFTMGSVRCAVRGYVRLTLAGRLALSLTLVGDGEQVRVTGIVGGQGGSHLVAEELERILNNL